MQKVTVATKNKQYDVHIGEGIYKNALLLYQHQLLEADHVVVFVDEAVAEFHLDALLIPLQKIVSNGVHVHKLPSGEASKSIEVYMDCHTFLLSKGCTRKSVIFAFGGGACGDVAGFVASTFMRGIPFYQCPTTILAHDSAVGGKTAINHPGGKNMIGTFYQPEAVLYDVTMLATLPEKEIRSGMAEVIKHSLISDEVWTKELYLLESFNEITPLQQISYLLKGIQVKARIVEADEYEHSVRRYLNLGHTYGHAIEASCGYGGITHGEAVAIGLVIALLLSEKKSSLDKGAAKQLMDLLLKLGYPFHAVLEHDINELFSYMKRDKKASFGIVYFVLLEKIGKPNVQPVTIDEIKWADLQLREWIKEAGR